MRKCNLLTGCMVISVLLVLYVWLALVSTNDKKPRIRPRHVFQSQVNDEQTRDGVQRQEFIDMKREDDQRSRGEDTLKEISAAREALEEYRLTQEQSFAEERERFDKKWAKLKADRDRLENEKEEFAVAVQLGVCGNRKQEAANEDEEFQKKREYLRGLPEADTKQFEGLNSTSVKAKYPGITLLPAYRMRTFVDPKDENMGGMQGSPKVIEDMDDVSAEERFYELVTMVHADCANIERMGNRGDGGWDLCMSHPYTPRSPCLVYSFGINNDFTFDDAISYRYNCDVRSFDPSMTTGDHKHSQKVWFYQLGLGSTNTVNKLGWRLETLGSIVGKCKHLGRTIDVLKIDIDYNEWPVFPSLVKEGLLDSVKQLVMEIHTPEVYIVNRPSTREDFYAMYNALNELELAGFRRFSVHYNIHGQYLSQRSGKHRTCCYELSYINIRYLNT